MFLILTHISVGYITHSCFFSPCFHKATSRGLRVMMSVFLRFVHPCIILILEGRFQWNLLCIFIDPGGWWPLTFSSHYQVEISPLHKISYSVREILVQNAEHIHNPTGTCPLDCNGPTTFQSCKILCDSRIYLTQTGFPGWYFIFSLIMWQCTRITTASFKALARKTKSAQSTP